MKPVEFLRRTWWSLMRGTNRKHDPLLVFNDVL